MRSAVRATCGFLVHCLEAVGTIPRRWCFLFGDIGFHESIDGLHHKEIEHCRYNQEADNGVGKSSKIDNHALWCIGNVPLPASKSSSRDRNQWCDNITN